MDNPVLDRVANVIVVVIALFIALLFWSNFASASESHQCDVTTTGMTDAAICKLIPSVLNR